MNTTLQPCSSFDGQKLNNEKFGKSLYFKFQSLSTSKKVIVCTLALLAASALVASVLAFPPVGVIHLASLATMSGLTVTKLSALFLAASVASGASAGAIVKKSGRTLAQLKDEHSRASIAYNWTVELYKIGMKSLPELKYCREQLTCLEKKLYALNTNEDGEQDEDVLECDAAAHIYDLVGGAYLNGTASIKELNDASKQAASRQIAWFSVDPSSAKMIERDQAKELYKLVAKKYNKGECSPHELTDAKIALEKAQKAYDITRR